ncbi:MAG: DUF448 domain-containing protein [Oscillospiraceae bacterium]|jgi:predicted RNA-binding protein YlxR (DUF448 family)|nr:DUF448 domain-containing protein [Oscillospiraceae bacterium]
MPKKVPHRMCAICKKRAIKKDLVRIVRKISNKKKVIWLVDRSFICTGRGMYICKNESCCEKIKRSKYFRKKISADNLETICAYIEEELFVYR